MDDLTERMASLGAPDPAEWAGSELRENIPQQARFLFLRAIWQDLVDVWAHEDVLRRLPAGVRLLESGASVQDLGTLARAVAYETAFGVVDRIDEGRDADAPADAPGWTLRETDSAGALTGRDVSGLHEDLLTLDPSGREGADLYR